MINTFLDRTETIRPTLALEYSFGRRSGGPGQGIQKQVCNVWELGSLSNSTSLLSVPLKSHGLKNFVAFIVLNLTYPDRLWVDLEAALKGLKQTVSSVASTEELAEMQATAKQRVGENHADLATLDLFPFPVVIVGGCYDKFQDFGNQRKCIFQIAKYLFAFLSDPAIKKHVGRCLRSIAHVIGAALIYHSTQHSTLSKTIRDTFSHFGFGTPNKPFRSTASDYNQPLIIWFGKDSWHNIGVGPTNSERIAVTYGSEIPQIENDDKSIVPTNPANDTNFREAVIDELRAQKDDELMRWIKDNQFRNKFQSTVE